MRIRVFLFERDWLNFQFFLRCRNLLLNTYVLACYEKYSSIWKIRVLQCNIRIPFLSGYFWYTPFLVIPLTFVIAHLYNINLNTGERCSIYEFSAERKSLRKKCPECRIYARFVCDYLNVTPILKYSNV